jgi:hypothetical protein
VAFCILQPSGSSASPSCVSEEFLRCKVDQVLDKVVEELISEVAFFCCFGKRMIITFIVIFYVINYFAFMVEIRMSQN